MIGNGVGIIVGQTSNDTIVDNDFENNYQGIVISGSASNVVVMENIITNIGRGEETKSPWIGSECGMYLHEASGAIIMENNITNGQEYGIRLEYSSNNTLKGNLIQNIKNLIWNSYFYEHSPAIFLYDSFNNTLIDNNVINNSFGIMTIKSGGNAIVHNNLINNTLQTFVIGEPYWPFGPPPANTWDYGYPSGGNYWSDYETEFPNATELDSSGIWSIPYQITTNNVDGYPLKSPVTIPEIPSALIPALLMITMTVAVIACRKWNETPET
jgi:parallel beta-helix repeat protein